jgi:predicted amidohydrolase YtcJ
MRQRGLVAPLLGLLACVGAPVQRPDLVFVNGRVFTGVPDQPWAEALAITGERLSAVGRNDAVRASAGAATRVVDLRGRLVIPGINDAHVHPGAAPRHESLGGPSAAAHDPTLAEVLERLKVTVARAPAQIWIVGEIGVTVLDDPGATRFALDAVAPDHPVMLSSWTGHGTLFNTAALRRLDVRDDELNPPGGFYRRMPGTKALSGVAHEYAEYRLRRRVQEEASDADHRAEFERFAKEAASLGITTVQAMMTALPVERTARLLTPGALPVRFRVIDVPMTATPSAQASAPVGDRLPPQGAKLILDGTPVERLMWLREPYADRPTRGQANFSADDLAAFVQHARGAGVQPMVHAVGDAAIDAVLEALDRTGGGSWQALRPRIEHGDLLRPDHYERARRVGAVLVQNPSHFMLPDVMRARLGDDTSRRPTAMRSIVAAGIPLALGSDGPLNPFLNLMFAVTNANNPSEALTLEQALVAYTSGSAFAEHQERDKGTLEVGKLADLAVLSQDIFGVPVASLPETTSVLTVVGGRIVHEEATPP